MTFPDVSSIVHLLASLAPVVFGTLIASVIVLNLAVLLAYRRVATLNKKLEESAAKWGGGDGKIATSIARMKATLHDIEEAIVHFESMLELSVSIEQKHEAQEQLEKLAQMKADQIADLTSAEVHAKKYAALEPEMKKSRDEFKKLQEIVRTNPTIILFLIRWLEYFGNRTPDNTLGKHREERSND